MVIVHRKYRMLFLSMVLCVSVASCAIAQTGEALLPESIMPVVILQGSEYDMGYQYGQQIPENIALMKEIAWAKALYYGDVRHPTLPDRDAVLHDLKAYLSILQEYAPSLIPFIQGIADGATDMGYDIAFHDVLLINTGIRRNAQHNYPPGAEALDLSWEGDKDCYT